MKRSIKKVLLIEPPFQRFSGFKCDWFPLGLGYIAAVLKNNGLEVSIYNADFHTAPQYLSYSKLLGKSDNYSNALSNPSHSVWAEVAGVINAERPDVVGISIKTVKLKAAQIIAGICKSVDKDIIIVAGGPHCTALAHQVLADANVDYVVRGEGEFVFAQLLDSVKRDLPLEKVGGLSYRSDLGIVHNADRAPVPDLDDIPFPERDSLVNRSLYAQEAFGDIITSRGCPFNCAYCASHLTWTKKVRYRSIVNILLEIKSVIRTYGTRQFTFWDDSFTLSKKRIVEFCSVLADEKLGINWGCNTRFDLLDEEVIRNMKRAGCNNVELGVESGSPRILGLMRKDVPVQRMQDVAELLRRHGLYWSGFFMVGLPTETRDDIKMTIDLMRKLRPNYATFSIFTPYPGTELWQMLLQKGVVSEDMDWHRFSHQSRTNNFTGTVDGVEFGKIIEEVTRAFDANNNTVGNLFKKALSKTTVYLHSPIEFVRDVRKYLNYAGITSKSN
jgi:anaerobic magnesium-protoporphyrin IX monomethyl ester cyclase